jgi:glutathione S-transferase
MDNGSEAPMQDLRPTLWQIDISHYSEKARWALDYKGVAYRRRSPMPGGHIPIALWLTRGRQPTFPVIELDGRTIGDSTAIIAALEERFPEPSLFPSDPAERRRALELEDWFDEELGPPVRLLAFHELAGEPERFADLAAQSAPAPLRRLKRPVGAYARTYTALRFRVRSRDAAAQARLKLVAAFDRLESELDSRDYLVGETFSVADLTAAALFYPLVLPPEGPASLGDLPESYDRFRGSVEERPGFRWVQEMFRRHRQPAAVSVAA